MEALFPIGLNKREEYAFWSLLSCMLLVISAPFGHIKIDIPFGNLELWFRAALAQLVEHIIRNDGVSSSSLLSGTRFYEKIK